MRYLGALRGAGDTLAPAIVTAVLCWGITVLGGYATARMLPQLGPAGPWYTATLYGVTLGIYTCARFVRGGWRSINLDASASIDKVANLEMVG